MLCQRTTSQSLGSALNIKSPEALPQALSFFQVSLKALHNHKSRHARFAFMPLSPKQRKFLHNHQNFHLQTTKRLVRLALQQRTSQRLQQLHYQQLLREQTLALQEENKGALYVVFSVILV
jgi:hypothetical protein